MCSTPIFNVPSHIPPELILNYPIKWGGITEEDVFESIIPQIHRDMPPVFYALDAYPGGTPAWVIRRSADLEKIYADTENFSSKDFAPFVKLIGESWSLLPAETDQPMHGSYRRWVNPLFTPKAISSLDDRIRRYAREYVAAIKAQGSCEFIRDFAFEFPIRIFIELMGMPKDMTRIFLEWEMDLLHANDLGVVATSARKVVDYLREEIAVRRKNPGDDLISYGIVTPIQGRPATPDELVGFAFNLFIGGLDTVSTNMAWQFRHLATHPEDQALLRERPELILDAIEEMMRAYPAVTTFRTVVNPVSLAGIAFQPGDKVAMATCLAGRDPEADPDVDIVRIGRKGRYLSFGSGPHLCVGMHLARREMRIAIEEFLREIPPFRIEDGYKMKTHTGGMLQPDKLPLVW